MSTIFAGIHAEDTEPTVHRLPDGAVSIDWGHGGVLLESRAAALALINAGHQAVSLLPDTDRVAAA